MVLEFESWLNDAGKYGYLMCPRCGFNHIGINEVRVKLPEYTTIIGPTQHTQIIKTENEDCWSKRGFIIELSFSCENCKGGLMEIYFRKGQTIVSFDENQEPFNTAQTIWRD